MPCSLGDSRQRRHCLAQREHEGRQCFTQRKHGLATTALLTCVENSRQFAAATWSSGTARKGSTVLGRKAAEARQKGTVLDRKTVEAQQKG
eukprot:SAG22_NODE_15145_length_356_cov_0.599222_1_plen_90_part_10